MFELLGLIAMIFIFGVVAFLAWLLLLPFYLLFKAAWFLVKVSFGGIMFIFMMILLLPLLIVAGVLFFLPLAILAIPLLLAIALFGWLMGFFKPSEAITTTTVV